MWTKKITAIPGRAVHAVSRTLLNSLVYTIRSGIGQGLRRRGGLGFIPRRPPPEARFLATLDLRGRTVLDVGGYEGIFTIFFARAVGSQGRVVTFEPNPLNCERIRENVRLNGFTNVEVRSMALGHQPGKVSLVVPQSEPARGSISADYQESLRRKQSTRTFEVEIDSLDNQLMSHGCPRPSFVKIDVEAAEMDVLMGMRSTLRSVAPALFIELHSGVDVSALVKLLLDHGYTIRHVESGSPIDLSLARASCPGHIYCTAGEGGPAPLQVTAGSVGG